MATKLIIFVSVFSVLAVVSEAGMPLGDDVTKAFRGISERLSMLKIKSDTLVKQRDRMRYVHDVILNKLCSKPGHVRLSIYVHQRLRLASRYPDR